MAVTYFNVIGNYSAFTPAGSNIVLRGHVLFTPVFRNGDVATGSGLTPPTAFVPVPVPAKIVNGVLQATDGSTLRLQAATADLNLSSPMYYTVTFANMMATANHPTLAGITVLSEPFEINTFSFQAPVDATPVNLISVTPAPGISSVQGVLSVAASQIADANAFTRGFLTSVTDQASARTYIGASTGGAGAEWEQYANLAAFPATGDTTKEYVAQDTGKIYRWTGSIYFTTALVKSDVGLGGVDNTADAAKNVLSATKLTTPRNINGVAFDGTANITVADATKEPAITSAATTTYLRGDKTFVALTQDVVPDGTTNKAYTATDKTRLAGTSGTNTGDQTSVSGNAGTATKLATPRNIAGVAFDGTADIALTQDNVPDGTTNKAYSAADKTRLAGTSGTNTGDQTTISGNAGTATKLATARNINGVAFDGTANITVADATKEPAITGAATTTYWRGDKTFVTLNADVVPDGTTNKAYTATEKTRLAGTSGTNTGDQTTVSGNAGTATRLATARNINGVAFDGSADIVTPGFATIATSGGTTPLTVTDAGVQQLTGILAHTVKLPTTGVAAGRPWTVINSSTQSVTVQSSGANTITVLPPGISATFTAGVATPTTAANWYSTFDAIRAGWLARDYGWLGWSHDPVSSFSGAVLIAGFVNLVAVKIPVPMTITNVITNVTVAGATLTAGQNFAGLYQNNALLAVTADQTTPWQSTGLKTMALASAQVVTPGTVYVAFWCNGTTKPSMACTVQYAGVLPIANTARFAFDNTNTGRTTTAPATLGTLGAGVEFWAAVS